MKHIPLNEYIKLKSVRCDKGKHKYRENSFGVTWCVICGQLSNNNCGLVEKLSEDDKLTIICQNND